MGSYDKGGLWVQTLGGVDCKHKWVLFDGNIPHCTLPYDGTRYTLIYFSQQSYERLGACRPGGGDRASIKSLGFPLPPSGQVKLDYEPASVRLRHAKAAFRKWKDCEEKGTAYAWNEEEDLDEWGHESDGEEEKSRASRQGGGRRKKGKRGQSDAFSWSDSEESDSDEDEDDEVGPGRNGTGWTWFIKGRRGVPFAGHPVPPAFVRKLGRRGGMEQLAANMLREQLGLVPTLRQRTRSRYTEVSESDSDMEGFVEGSDSDDGQPVRKRTKGGRKGKRAQEKPAFMDGIRAKATGKTAEEDDTPAHLAKQLNVDVAQLVWLNKEWYPSLHANAPLQAGTVLQIPDTPGALEGDYAIQEEEDDEPMPDDDDEEGENWYQVRRKDKFSPKLSRAQLRRLALSGGVVEFRWAADAIAASDRKSKAAAYRRQRALAALEPQLLDYYKSGKPDRPAGEQRLITTFYSLKALAKRKGVPLSALQPEKKRRKRTKAAAGAATAATAQVPETKPAASGGDDGWSVQKDPKSGEGYWWHASTLTSSWTHPTTGLFPDGSMPAEPATFAVAPAEGRAQGEGAAAEATPAPADEDMVAPGSAEDEAQAMDADTASVTEGWEEEADGGLPVMDMS